MLGSHCMLHHDDVTRECSCLGTGVPGTGTPRFAIPLPLSDKLPSPVPGLTMHKTEMETSPKAVSLLRHRCTMAPDAG